MFHEFLSESTQWGHLQKLWRSSIFCGLVFQISLLHFQGTIHGSHDHFLVSNQKQQHPPFRKITFYNVDTDQGSTDSISIQLCNVGRKKKSFNNKIPAAVLLVQKVMCYIFLQILPNVNPPALQLPLPGSFRNRRRSGILLERGTKWILCQRPLAWETCTHLS